MKLFASLKALSPDTIISSISLLYRSRIDLFTRLPSSYISAGADELSVNSLIVCQSLIRYSKSLLISVFVLCAPAVLIITPIPSGIFIELIESLILFLVFISEIFLEIPPPLAVLGMSTQYLPARDIYVVNAAPLLPRSSFVTCINIICLFLITSCILYLFLCLLNFSGCSSLITSSLSLESLVSLVSCAPASSTSSLLVSVSVVGSTSSWIIFSFSEVGI